MHLFVPSFFPPNSITRSSFTTASHISSATPNFSSHSNAASSNFKTNLPNVVMLDIIQPKQNKLFIGNLPRTTTDAELYDAFEKYGDITEAIIMEDRVTGQSKGFGFISYETEESAAKAAAEMDGFLFDGRPIRVDVAVKKPSVVYHEGQPRPTDSGALGGGRGGVRQAPTDTKTKYAGFGDDLDEDKPRFDENYSSSRGGRGRASTGARGRGRGASERGGGPSTRGRRESKFSSFEDDGGFFAGESLSRGSRSFDDDDDDNNGRFSSRRDERRGGRGGDRHSFGDSESRGNYDNRGGYESRGTYNRGSYSRGGPRGGTRGGYSNSGRGARGGSNVPPKPKRSSSGYFDDDEF